MKKCILVVLGLTALLSQFKNGDVNNDHKVDVKDVVQMQRYIKGIDVPNFVDFVKADMNCDGKITESDMVMIQEIIVGIR